MAQMYPFTEDGVKIDTNRVANYADRTGMKRTAALFCFLSLFLLSACGESEVRRLEREERFALELGKLDDQIDLFITDDGRGSARNRIYTRDGRIYLSNGNASKVMEFSGYGDLLVLLYDPTANPRPILPTSDGGFPTTRRAVAHEFHDLGEIAVGDRRTVLVEDRLRENGEHDEEHGVQLRSRVLRFEAGRYVDYIGQEGVGGTPFPYIETLELTENGDIVVVSRNALGRHVYWYSPEGELRYEIPVRNDQLPMPERDDLIPVLERIRPDLEERHLYLKLDYYEQVDGDGGQSDLGEVFSQVYVLDLDREMYTEAIEIPRHTTTERPPPDFEPVEVNHLYRFIGVGPGGYLYFVSRDAEESSELLIMDRNGQVNARRRIVLEDAPLVDYDMSVSPEGILVALLGREDGAQIVWWRTDRLID